MVIGETEKDLSLRKNWRSCYRKGENPKEFICKSCEAMYRSRKGLHHHLSKACGTGSLPKAKGSQNSELSKFYRTTEDGIYYCNICEKPYNSRQGLYNHIKKNYCHDEKHRNYQPQHQLKDWRKLYSVEEGTFICRKCNNKEFYRKGIINHLKQSLCGSDAEVKLSFRNPRMSWKMRRLMFPLFSIKTLVNINVENVRDYICLAMVYLLT